MSLSSRSLWIFLSTLLVIDIIWLWAEGFTVNPFPFVFMIMSVIILAGIIYFYTYKRPDQKITDASKCFLIMILFTNVLAHFSYVSLSLNLPLIDATLAGFDTAIGYDWMAVLAWTNEHPTIGWVLTFAYRSTGPQVFLVVLILSFLQRQKQLHEFIWLYMITGSTVIFIAAIFPAAGAYIYYAPPAELFANLNPEAGVWHWQHFQGLRDGSMRHIDLSKIEGLVTYPSFHTCLAIITTWAVVGIRYVFPIAFFINTLVIISTLTEGGHHLADVFAGAGVSIVAMWAMRADWRKISAFVGFPPKAQQMPVEA
ncbi:MAG: phosphatase PAP2 family protein [Hyphomicrobiaceae bacterium]